jgi:glyceraldehyde 3-phosphate dehydrogenase
MFFKVGGNSWNHSLGRIGKLTLWHHIGAKYFDEIIVNQGREIGRDLYAVAQFIEKDSHTALCTDFYMV